MKEEKNIDKKGWFMFHYRNSFIEMQSDYFINIFEDNHNIVRDRFVTDLVNMTNNRPLVAKKYKELSIYVNLAQSQQKTMEIVTNWNNNTRNFHKPNCFVTNSWET